MKTINELTFNKVVYYIKTEKAEGPEIENQIGDELLDLFKSLMTQKEAQNYVVFSEENTEEEYVFLFISKNKILQIIDFLKSKGALKSFKEISTDILMDRIISDDFNNTFLKKDEFNHILDKFIFENLTVNVVLDKINESGINSLKKIDYNVLASNNESNSKSIDFYYSRGRIKNDLKDYNAAIEDFTKAIQLNPKDEKLFFERGWANSELKDYIKAKEDFTKAIELRPDDEVLFFFRGCTKNDLGDYKGALKDYIKSIELNAEYTEAYVHRGILNLELKEIKGACLDFKKAKELGCDDVNFLLEEHCK